MAELKIILKKSIIGSPERQKQTAKTLGLRKIGGSVVQPDNQCIRGMIAKIVHLVEIEEIN